ncbi:MAG: DUF1998 domain-containing protein [Gammaproteobacteria bacterium]|nr:DUF1998 domain-containing protein [Gammaproteobacteria bacterium]
MTRKVPTRWSHLVGYSGVGAVARADNDLYVIKDISHWADGAGEPAGHVIPYVDLLRATLGIDRELRQPPLSRVLPNGQVQAAIPAMRFPGWMHCPGCGLLYWLPWRDAEPSEDKDPEQPPRCRRCKDTPALQHVGWVLAHPEGGLEEVPWQALAHREDKSKAETCRVDRKSSLITLKRDTQTGTGWELHCERCQASARFDPRQAWPGGDPRRQPWERFNAHERNEGQSDAEILEVSDPRLYYPRTRSALVIPPESRVRRGTVLDRLYSNRADRDELDRARPGLARRQRLRSLASRYGCSPGEIDEAWDELNKGYPLYGQAVTPGDLMAKEHRALCEEIPDLADSEDFVPRHQTHGWHAQSAPTSTRSTEVLAAVDRLVALTRLREVRILEGFTRITQNVDDGLRPLSAKDGDNVDVKAQLVKPDLDGSLDWLPAIELYGEGIFLTLSEPMLRRWASQSGLQKRTRALERRFESTGMRFPDAPILPLVPRFVLLHTLAHLLIRQLETQAGYPAASIRERIYCAEGGEPMAGILVYVAVPDIVGSLGGLAELAEPPRFLQLLSDVFSRADWCSLDPVCGEHEGQGPSQLNLAACHACALVPEPSCQFSNLLLDRVFVRGDLGGGIRPLLDFALSGR